MRLSIPSHTTCGDCVDVVQGVQGGWIVGRSCFCLFGYLLGWDRILKYLSFPATLRVVNGNGPTSRILS
jgi:hypothetical protein